MEKTRPFEDLNISTETIMCYTDAYFNIEQMFYKLPITHVNVTYTKKQKNVDKKNLQVDYGNIISLHYKNLFRGVYTRKKKKRFCTICQPCIIDNGKKTQILTITEEIDKALPEDIEKILGKEALRCKDIMQVYYYCSKCKKRYHPREIKKINHFLNQISIVISIGKSPLIDVMLFKNKTNKNSLKLAACKNLDDAMETVFALWQDLIMPDKTLWYLGENAKATSVKFIFEQVMINVGFCLGFNIDRTKLNQLFNDDSLKKNVFFSSYEPTGHSNVNIKMYSTEPENFKLDVLVFPLDGKQAVLKKVPIAQVKPPKKKPKKVYNTFIVFASSEIIMSGRYYENMKQIYDYFIYTILSNKNKIKEKTRAVEKVSLQDIISGKFEK